MLVSLFVSPDHGNIVQDTFPLSPAFSRSLGCKCPSYTFSMPMMLRRRQVNASPCIMLRMTLYSVIYNIHSNLNNVIVSSMVYMRENPNLIGTYNELM